MHYAFHSCRRQIDFSAAIGALTVVASFVVAEAGGVLYQAAWAFGRQVMVAADKTLIGYQATQQTSTCFSLLH
jgi:hypothetical protein